jgi:uncharacterized protein YutE (UPF0331/DUF86 family)
MADKLRLDELILKIIGYYEEFVEMTENVSLEEYKSNTILKRAIDKQIEIIIGKAIDINNEIAKMLEKMYSTDYSSFVDLAEFGIIDMDLALKIAPSAGLRNILVHEYEEIDDEKVYTSFNDIKIFYKEYIRKLKSYLL